MEFLPEDGVTHFYGTIGDQYRTTLGLLEFLRIIFSPSLDYTYTVKVNQNITLKPQPNKKYFMGYGTYN